MKFTEKLDYLMEKNKLNKSTLSKACGIPYTTIDGWYKRGYEGLKIATLCKLCNYFDTTLDFWVKDSETLLTLDEHQHIKKYRQLDAYGKRWIDLCVNHELERIESPGEYIMQESTMLIPYYQKLASAGTGQIIWDDLPFDEIEIPKNDVTQTADFALGINGDSMEPLYWDSDTVLVKKTNDIDIGDIGVFNLDGECYIKQLGDHKLISVNPSYRPVDIGEKNFRCIGKVIINLTEHSANEISYKLRRTDYLHEYQSMYPMAAEKGMTNSANAQDFVDRLREESKKIFKCNTEDLNHD